MADKTLPPLAFGDSLADGIRTNNKLEGKTRSGAGPREVLDMILSYSLNNSLEGRDVYIGTGIPNIPTQKNFIDEQIELVKRKGGRPILIGVGPGTEKHPTTGQNEFLAELTKRKGLPFMGPLVNTFPDVVKDPMGLHLRPAQYKQIVKQFSSDAFQAPPREVQQLSKPQPQPQPRVEVAPPPPPPPPPPKPSAQSTRESAPLPAPRAPTATNAANMLSQMPGLGKGEKFDPDVYLQDPNVNKFLDYINVYEGSPKANQMVGFKEFNDFRDHPRTPVVFNKKGDRSDAAGMFQILSRTWDGQRKKLGLTDFSLINQKRAAVGILRDIGALPDIVSGNFDKAKPKAARQWASIPGSTIGLSTGQVPRYKEKAEKILGQPTKRAENPMMPRVEAPVDYAPGSTLETASRPAEQQPQQNVVTRADMERMGPNYQAAFAATTLADSREDDDEYDDDETVAERYLERRNEQMAQEESTLEQEEPTRTSALAGLELSYQSPFPEVQPVMMAEGGEAKSMMRRMYESAIPAQVRTFAETALMPADKRAASPITEQNFTDEEQRQILDTIVNARGKRMQERGLTTVSDPAVAAKSKKLLKKALNLSPASVKDLEEAQKKKKIEDKYFLSGKGSVFYGDYPNAFTGKVGAPVQNLRDSTVSREGAIRNTLGRFVYETTPEGKIRIKDNYEFANDLVEEMNQRPSSAYEGMSTTQKLNALLMDTLHNKQDALLGSGMKVGRATLPSRVGSAFIGERGRPVDVTIDPRELMPGYAGYANGGVVHRANGSPIYGEGFDTGPITEDTRRAFANRQSFNPREALAALKRIAGEGVSNLESMARGSVAGVPGIVGDVESIFRDDKARRFATSTEIERQRLPGRMTAPTKESQGFVEIGTAIDPSIALKAAPKTAKAALKAVKSAGPQIEATLGKMAPVAQPMYAVKPKGGVFYPQGSGSKLDNYLDKVVQQIGRNAPNVAGKDAQKIADFIQNKGRKYLTTTYGTGDDPVREAILEGRLVLTGDDAEKIRGYALSAAREGSPEALKDVERAYDSLTEMRGSLMLPDKTPWMESAGKRTAAQELESAKMAKEGVSEDLINPSILSKEMEELQRTYSSDSEKMLAALMAKERAPVMGAEKAVMMAAEKGEPIYDLSTSSTGFDILNPRVVAQGIATIPVADLERMSFPEAIIRGAQNTLLERSGDAVVAAVEKGKSIPQKFYTEGVTPIKGLEDAGWVTVNTPFAVKLEGAAMKHSVGGYADVGSYGHGGKEAFLSGKAKVFSLRPEGGKPAVTVEARVDPDGLYISQVKAPYNSAPTPQEKQKIFELFDSLRPYDFKAKNQPEQYSRTRTGDTTDASSINWAEEYSNYLQYRNKGAE